MRRTLLTLLLATPTLAAPLAAQTTARLAAPEAPRLHLSGAQARAGGGAAPRALVHVMAGALVGAGAGYLASQVIWSDWDRTADSGFGQRRLTFALGGGAVGTLAGLVLGHSSAAAGAPNLPNRVPAPRQRSRSLLSAEELRASTAVNLYQLLQAVRPEWLQGRGEGPVRAGRQVAGNPSAEPDESTPVALPTQNSSDEASSSPAPRVYVDGAFVGDINQLKQMGVREAEYLEFLDVATATYRFGPGNLNGVILVHTGHAHS